jgi:hypothetical protein
MQLDAMASSLKAFRTRLQEVAQEHEKREYTIYESIKERELHRIVDGFSSEFNTWRSRGELTSLSVEVASDIALLLKYVKGKLPVEDFWVEFEGKKYAQVKLVDEGKVDVLWDFKNAVISLKPHNLRTAWINRI